MNKKVLTFIIIVLVTLLIILLPKNGGNNTNKNANNNNEESIVSYICKREKEYPVYQIIEENGSKKYPKIPDAGTFNLFETIEFVFNNNNIKDYDYTKKYVFSSIDGYNKFTPEEMEFKTTDLDEDEVNLTKYTNIKYKIYEYSKDKYKTYEDYIDEYTKIGFECKSGTYVENDEEE